jgi:DHA1 family bicyclomycin/chloramphenicol resistance-like MFS transporter
MLRPNTFALTALLSALTGIAPLTVDMYLPSMPDIGRLLAASPAQVQLTLSCYLAGFGIGQVVYGPVSDRHGRRPVLLTALAIYCVASIACAVAPTIELLIAARFFQAVGGAGTVVLARAVARDLYDGIRLGRELSLMAAIMAFAPIIAPLFGGVLQTAFGWRSNFVMLFAVGIALAAMVWVMLPETLRARATDPVSFASTFRIYRTFLRNRWFLAHVAIGTASVAGLFAWLSGASFVLQDLYGLSPMAFAIAFTLGSGGYLVGTWTAARIVTRVGLDRTIGIGSLALALGGLGMLVAPALAWTSAAALVVPITVYLFGLGLVLPQTMAGALTPFPDRAGAASSLVGFMQQMSGAIIGAVVGHLLGQSAWPLSLGVAAMGCLALVLWTVTRSLRAGEAPRHV